jgi:O-antigen/teichoic acid export membrane protein
MHLSAMGVFGSVAGQLGNIFIFHFLGPVSLALYSFASAVPERLGSIFFKFLNNAMLPKFAERTVEEVRAQLLRKMIFAFSAGIVIAVIYALCAPLFFHTFFPAYSDAIPYTVVFGIGLAFAAAIYIPLSALTALKHTRALYLYNILNPIVQIIFPLTGIWLGGLWGYLIAHILTVIFAVGLATVLVYKSDS